MSPEVNENFQLSRQYWAYLAQMLCSGVSLIKLMQPWSRSCKNKKRIYRLCCMQTGKCLDYIPICPKHRFSCWSLIGLYPVANGYWSPPRKGLVNPDKFISTTPHMTFAHGEEQIAWLKKRGSHPKGFLNTTQILWLDHFPLLKHEETTNWGKIMHFPMHPVQHSGFKALQDHPLFQGSLAVVGASGWFGFCKGLEYIYGDYVTTELSALKLAEATAWWWRMRHQERGMKIEKHYHRNRDHDHDVDDVVD